MIRLHAVVEGQTEETFIRDILAPEFGTQAVFIDVHRITTGRKRSKVFRGGITAYGQLKDDLVLWMKQNQNTDAWFTTMVDLYALPWISRITVCALGIAIRCNESSVSMSVSAKICRIGDSSHTYRCMNSRRCFSRGRNTLRWNSPGELLQFRNSKRFGANSQARSTSTIGRNTHRRKESWTCCRTIGNQSLDR